MDMDSNTTVEEVEQNEKPVDGCLGYINHGQDNEGKGKKLVKIIGGK